MNYGQFFEYDFESSSIEKGIAVFNYRWLEHISSNVESKTPQHPIYLSFTPESISFNLHYLDNNDLKKTNATNDFPLWKHHHNTIIKLYLSSNINTADKLTKILNDIYWTVFPTSIDFQLKNDIINSFETQFSKEEGFATFECFKPENKHTYNRKEDPHFLRKVILDFLYDFEFTDVFKNIPFYDKVSAKLKESFLFNALLNKTRYYYYRTVLTKREVFEPCKDEKDFRIEDTRETEKRILSFAELYAKYEKEWIYSILDKRAMQLFHESPWFEESNVELEQVYWSRRKGRWSIINVKRQSAIKNIDEVGDVLELNKNVQFARNRKKYLHKIGADKDSFALTVEDVVQLLKISVSSKESIVLEKTIKYHGAITNSAAKWEVVHYHFLGLLKMWSGNMSTLFWSFVLLIPIFLFSLYGLFYITHCSEVKDAHFLIFVISWYLVIWGYRGFMRQFFRQTWGCGYWSLQMPHLLAAVVAAWFTMSMNPNLFKLFALKPDALNLYAVAILFLITLLFVGYESRQLNPYDKPIYNIFSSIFFIGIAYFYSVVVGLMVFDYFGVPMIKNIIRAENCHCVCSTCTCALDNYIVYKKEFLFQFSFFATFMGIFLQLMFKGRPVTDSNT